MRTRLLIGCLVATGLAGCGDAAGIASMLDFQPQARSGGEFILSLGGEDTGTCALSDVARFEVRVSGPDLREPMAYDLGTDDLVGDCELRLLVPEGLDRAVEVEGYAADDTLVRKGWGVVTSVTAGEVVSADLALWPALRHLDTVGDSGAGPDLTAFDAVRMTDRWLLVLRFAADVRPANDGGAASVAGFLAVADDASARTWRVALDATRSDGLDWVDIDSPIVDPDQRLAFSFAANEMRIVLPYSRLGAGTSGTTPAASFAVVLQDNAGESGAATDALPDAALTEDGTVNFDADLLPLR
jgi:hypothetical protein